MDWATPGSSLLWQRKQAMKSKLTLTVLLSLAAVAARAPGYLSLSAAATRIHSKKIHYKFDFGPGRIAPGYTRVLPTTIYSKWTGYGFEPGATVSGVDRGGKDAWPSDFITSNQPFFFSVALPEGNYNVTVTLGDAKGETSA